MLLENVVIDDSNIIMNIEHGYDTDIKYLNSNFLNQFIKFSYKNDAIEYNHLIPRETNIDGVEKHIYRFLNSGITLSLWSKDYPEFMGLTHCIRIDIDGPLKASLLVNNMSEDNYNYLMVNLQRIYETQERVGRKRKMSINGGKRTRRNRKTRKHRR
jgi:hypothetical protein